MDSSLFPSRKLQASPYQPGSTTSGSKAPEPSGRAIQSYGSLRAQIHAEQEEYFETQRWRIEVLFLSGFVALVGGFDFLLAVALELKGWSAPRPFWMLVLEVVVSYVSYCVASEQSSFLVAAEEDIARRLEEPWLASANHSQKAERRERMGRFSHHW